MAIIDHDDRFRINDIEFKVPPTQISIQRDSANYEWQTLRTKNAQKVKSGHGTVNVSFSVIFIGKEDINSRLRLLIAQLRLTPICVVDNKYLRDALLSDSVLGNADKSICLILKAMTLTVQPELKDSIIANFTFAFFNYLPYIDRLTFKRDIFDLHTENDPANSRAWIKFYNAELEEGNYTPVRLEDSVLSFFYKEFFTQNGNVDETRGGTFTGIKYESSNTANNGLSLFTLAKKVTCSQETERIVTSVTISFENIVAALPVIGHQYMTYQHIGSVDPRVIITMSVMSDVARNDLLDMWHKIEQNAIDWRHIPQEHLNVTIQNDLVNLVGLKTFITDSITDETIPGQPGTYQITLSLRGTDYLHTREEITQEYVTTEQVRKSISNTLQGLLITIPGKPISFAPNFPATTQKKALDSLVLRFINTANNITSKLGIGSNRIMSFNHQGNQGFTSQSILAVPGFEDFTSDGVINKQDNLQTIDPGLENIDLYQLAKENNMTEELGDIANLADGIVLTGLIELPEFFGSKLLVEETGAFRGKSAYPDFTALSSIARSININPIDLNPDFYFSDGSSPGKSFIDPGLYRAAQAAAEFLYVKSADTNSTVGNFINKISTYMEDTYIKRFDPKSETAISFKDAATKIKNIYNEDHLELKSSRIKDGIANHINWTNSLSEERTLSVQSFGQNVLNELPEKSEDKGIKCIQTPITHYGDFAEFIDGEFASYDEQTSQQLGIPIWPVGSKTRISSLYGMRDISEQNPHASKDHKGIDFAVGVGTPVKAMLDGTVIRADGIGDPGGFGNFVVIKHADEITSGYAHLSRIYVYVGDVIKGGDIVGRSGGKAGMEGAGNSLRAHLHFEIKKHGEPTDPLPFLLSGNVGSQAAPVVAKQNLDGTATLKNSSSGEGFQFGTSILARSMESLELDMASGQGPSMRRAYPTFKLYFMEEDQEDRIFGFDDFFNYNAVKSIRVIRSRKVPTDLCVIELTNVSGILSNRKFKNTFNDQGLSTESSPKNDSKTVTENVNDAATARNTAEENSITSIMLQEGTKVFLRLGYSNDPEKLEPVFVGQIAEVEFSDTDDLITIVCQSYASELVQQTKGLEKPVSEKQSLAGGGWLLGFNKASTPRLLSDMLQQPEVLHFGRWIRSKKGAIPSGTFDPRGSTNTNLPTLTNRFKWNPNPVDDNIFPPVISSKKFEEYFSVEKAGNTWVETGANALLDWGGAPAALHISPINYYIFKMTIWDIFKEMELRHPGCIASPVPYMDAQVGPRMTMFFGMPNQLYFARDPSYKEQYRNNNNLRVISENADRLRSEKDAASDATGGLKNTPENVALIRRRGGSSVADLLVGSSLLIAAPYLGIPLLARGFIKSRHPYNEVFHPADVIDKQQINDLAIQVQRVNALKDRSVRPFRSYHVLTSNNHIIENNIRASSIDVFNAVAVEHTNTKIPVQIATAAVAAVVLPSLGPELAYFASSLEAKSVYRLKADAGIPDEEVREAFIQYPSCEGEQMAEFYALGSLKNNLRDIYKGQLTIIGNPSIKPYDICYVFDEYTDMVGPVEVEQVVHEFSQQTGFITEITPDICVSINEWTTMGTMDAIGLTVEGILESVFNLKTRIEKTPQSRLLQRSGLGNTVNKLIKPVGVAAAATILTNPVIETSAPVLIPALALQLSPIGAIVAPFAVGGIFLANKLVHWSRMRHPINFSPLMYKGRPFMAAMGSKTINANWWTNIFGFGDGEGANAGWIKEVLSGGTLLFDKIGDSLVFSADTGNINNIGFSGLKPGSNPNP